MFEANLNGTDAAQYPTARWHVEHSLVRNAASDVGEHGRDDPRVTCQRKVEL